jgi:hypothetical protein
VELASGQIEGEPCRMEEMDSGVEEMQDEKRPAAADA